jgi:predicted nucleic acid-binding protein
MVSGLLDTSIIVDNLRSYPPAVNWLANNPTQLGITHIVRLEVIEGAKDKQGQQRSLTLLNDFEQIELTTSDLIWASEQLLRFHLSHNVSSFDCLIASASFRLGLPLYTINLKHFTPLLGTLAQKPY